MRWKCLIILLSLLLTSCGEKDDLNSNVLKFYGDALEDIGYSIALTDNGYIIGGQLTNVSRTNGNIIDKLNSVKKMGIVKTASDGDQIWKNSFGDNGPSKGAKVIVLEDGSIISAGYVSDTATLAKSVLVVKTDRDGNLLFQKIFKTIGEAGNQYATDIVKTPEGFLILGTTDIERQPLTDSTGNEAGKLDILLLKTDNNLNLISSYGIGFPGNEEGIAIKADKNGGFIIIGNTDRSDKPRSQQDGSNLFLIKINPDGKDTQSKIIGGTGDEYAADIETLEDGYLVAGNKGSEGSDQSGCVWKVPDNIYTDVTPKIIQIDEVSSAPASFSIRAVSRYKAQSFVMAGQYGKGSSSRMLIFVTDEIGNILSDKKIITGGTGIQVAYDVISDYDDNIIVVGKNSYEDNSMISLYKFRF